jgi:hypothetical protein
VLLFDCISESLCLPPVSLSVSLSTLSTLYLPYLISVLSDPHLTRERIDRIQRLRARQRHRKRLAIDQRLAKQHALRQRRGVALQQISNPLRVLFTVPGWDGSG